MGIRLLNDLRGDTIFIVYVPLPNINSTRTCGGCTMLHVLAEQLHTMGEKVATLPYWGGNQLQTFLDFMSNRPEKAVIVYPEAERPLPVPHVHVHWMLSPVGGIGIPGKSARDRLKHWGQHDLVFNYGLFNPGTAKPVTTSNLLQVLLDPAPDDAFQIDKYPSLPRNGTVFTVRKAGRFHGEDWSFIHPANATELKGGASMEMTIHAFLTHEYFVCYDPYSYLSWIAAMLGCISIIHPFQSMTKQQWLMSTMFGGYIEHTGLQDWPGIAYGWDASEIKHAERTKHLVREILFQVKEFSHSVTVPRFVRDAKRAARGAYGSFEGAMTVSELYPVGWYEHQVETQGSFAQFARLPHPTTRESAPSALPATVPVLATTSKSMNSTKPTRR